MRVRLEPTGQWVGAERMYEMLTKSSSWFSYWQHHSYIWARTANEAQVKAKELLEVMEWEV